MSKSRPKRDGHYEGQPDEDFERTLPKAPLDELNSTKEIQEGADSSKLNTGDTFEDEPAIDIVSPYNRERERMSDFRVDAVDYTIIDGFDSKGATKADFEWCVVALDEVIRPGVNRGMLRQDFEKQDDAARQSSDVDDLTMRSYGMAYDLFFGQEKIVLHRETDGKLGVTNGRHRIEMARQLGVTTLPGHILESPREAIEPDSESEVPPSETDAEAYESLPREVKRDILVGFLTALPSTSSELKEVYGAEFDNKRRQWHVYFDEQYNPGDWKRHNHLTLMIGPDGGLTEASNMSHTNRPISALVVESMQRKNGLSGICPATHIRGGLDEVAVAFNDRMTEDYRSPITECPTLTNVKHKEGRRTIEYTRTYNRLLRLLDENASKLDLTDRAYSADTLKNIRPMIDKTVDNAVSRIGENRLARALFGSESARKNVLEEFAREMLDEIEGPKHRN